METLTLHRRRVLQGLGGLTLAFSLDPAALHAQAGPPRLPGSLQGNRTLNAWLRIEPDGTATVFTGKVEFGQALMIALTQIAAEELDLPLTRITLKTVDTDVSPNEGFTFGSQSIENSGLAIRLACAEARAILLDLAAKKLGVAADTLATKDGTITGGSQSVTYAALASEIDLKREATGKVAPKAPARHAIVGRPIQRPDIVRKVTGGASYIQDLRPDGMAHGRVVRPPRYGATLASLDEKAARALPGVLAVVRDGSFLGVIAEREEVAIKARAVLAEGAQWSGGRDLPEPATLFEHLKKLPKQTNVVNEKKGELPNEVRRFEATYLKPYMSHASIGPSCALAQWDGGKVTVWTHAQGPFPLRNDIAKGLKVPPAQIRVIHAEGAGCYGHNGADDAALDAALIARALLGRPVRVQWMRDDEFAWAPYGCAMAMQIKAALDSSGRIIDWDYEVWGNTHSMRPNDPDGNNLLASWSLAEPQKHGTPRDVPIQFGGGGDRNAVPLYDFPRQRVTNNLITDMPVRVSALRTLGAYSNVFASECFMDELATAAGADPVAFRLAHMKDARARAVIEKAAAMAGWTPGASDGKRGRGIAFSRYKNSTVFVAVVAEVEVDRDNGRVRVPRAWAAADAGLIINPDGLAAQIDGGIAQAASWTLYEEVAFDTRAILSRDWTTYPIMAMPDVPRIAVELINRTDQPSLGAGEGSQGPAGAAIVNAFAHATGRRIRQVPLTPDRVKAALA